MKPFIEKLLCALIVPFALSGIACGIVMVHLHRQHEPGAVITDAEHNRSVLVIGGTNVLKITGSDATNLVLWSRSQPVVTKTHEGWTVRFGK